MGDKTMTADENSTAPRIRESVLGCVESAPGVTVANVASVVGVPVDSVRNAVSELRKDGLIAFADLRRTGARPAGIQPRDIDALMAIENGADSIGALSRRLGIGRRSASNRVHSMRRRGMLYPVGALFPF